jgi:hypothetical protein
MFSKVLQQRYLATNWHQVVDRILHGPIWRLYKFGEPVTVGETERLHWALSNKIFIPAGNTLTFQAPFKKSNAVTLRPNCAIKVGITPQAATRIWEEGTGFGTTVDFPDENPVDHLRRLQDAWNSFKDPEHRPKRGNMYVYPARGKYVHEFIKLKSDPKTADEFPAFNVSVGFQNFEEEVGADPQIISAIAEAAWKTGDPGVVFLDRVNRNVPLEHRSKYIKTLVPCGEQGMFDHETCTLGSINLNASELRNADGNLSLTKFEVAIRTAVRFLDNAVDVTQTSAHTMNPYRRIGLGVMGWADVLESHGMDYNSPSAFDWAEELSKFMGAIARHESTRLAVARRSAFPAWYRERINMNFALEQQDFHTLMKHGYVLEAGEVLRERQRWGMRNVSVTCIAPTGGISLLTGNKGFSIEPAFEDVHDISTYGHLQMLNAWQSGMCNSVSKTINFPNRAEPQDFLDAILEARNLPNIKALSMYRMGSRAAQPIA